MEKLDKQSTSNEGLYTISVVNNLVSDRGRGSIRPFVRPSDRGDRVKNRITRVLDTFCVCLCVVWGGDGGGTPLPICPQRFCDPGSLVTLALSNSIIGCCCLCCCRCCCLPGSLTRKEIVHDSASYTATTLATCTLACLYFDSIFWCVRVSLYCLVLSCSLTSPSLLAIFSCGHATL